MFPCRVWLPEVGTKGTKTLVIELEQSSLRFPSNLLIFNPINQGWTKPMRFINPPASSWYHPKIIFRWWKTTYMPCNIPAWYLHFIQPNGFDWTCVVYPCLRYMPFPTNHTTFPFIYQISINMFVDSSPIYHHKSSWTNLTNAHENPIRVPPNFTDHNHVHLFSACIPIYRDKFLQSMFILT